MEEILKDLNQLCVKFEKHHERNYAHLINNVCTTIIQELRKDELFNFLFQGPLYVNYYSGLKIKKANQYEIKLVLVLPKELQQQSGMDTVSYPGTAKNRLFIVDKRTMFHKIEKTLCTDISLDCLKVNEWFEGLIEKALNMYPDSLCKCNGITMRQYGRGKTLIINDCICLDLVPCFELDLCIKPLPNYNQHELIKHQEKYYLLVPKISYDRIQKCPQFYWRVSFPKQEQQCLNNLDKLNAAVRLLKLIRDDRNHKILCNYFIQTIAMQHVIEIRSSERFPHWTLSEIFLDLLESLIQSVTCRNIPFFWWEKINLLENCTEIYLHDLEVFLKRFKLRILQDPEYIKKYISMS